MTALQSIVFQRWVTAVFLVAMVLGAATAYAQDVWVFRAEWEELRPGAREDVYVDLDTLRWKSADEFYVETKCVRSSGDVRTRFAYCFDRLTDKNAWMVSQGSDRPSERYRKRVGLFAWAQEILNACYCDLARSNAYRQNVWDSTFQEVKTHLDQMGGVWYDAAGNPVRVDGMSLDGYPILEAYDLIGGDPGNVEIVLRTPDGCRAVNIAWMTAPFEQQAPYLEMDGVEYHRMEEPAPEPVAEPAPETL